MMVDERFCTVGSTNLNSRSLRYDYEINAFVFDLPITAQLTEIFSADKQNSTIMTKEVYKKRTPWKRFVGWSLTCLPPCSDVSADKLKFLRNILPLSTIFFLFLPNM